MQNRLFLKPGVVLNGISTEMLFAVYTASHIYNNFNQNLTITSAKDGKHSINSLHYSGQAIDFRTYDVDKKKMQQIYSEIKFSLDNRGYDVVLESDHLHIEWDPKKTDVLQKH